ncbi:MAG: type II toxin-antitoxin system RelE/ParE family toxin [Planctomycetes bacterium]|nr:type II toxin-antitoxin system RelE/ParE family toxin [Planctomycetota bacterium]
MAEVHWSVTAADDLVRIEEFIARDSHIHAVRFVDALVDSCDRLGAYPRMGRVVPEFERTDLRELQFRGYRIVYWLRGKVVNILRVVHGARDLVDLVHREPWEIG